MPVAVPIKQGNQAVAGVAICQSRPIKQGGQAWTGVAICQS